MGIWKVWRTIKHGKWELILSETAGTTYISVPDCGGMADAAPRVPEQLAWAEATFAKLPALERVWPTTWRVPPEALPALEALLREHGACW